jgi:hypothetical protein
MTRTEGMPVRVMTRAECIPARTTRVMGDSDFRSRTERISAQLRRMRSPSDTCARYTRESNKDNASAIRPFPVERASVKLDGFFFNLWLILRRKKSWTSPVEEIRVYRVKKRTETVLFEGGAEWDFTVAMWQAVFSLPREQDSVWNPSLEASRSFRSGRLNLNQCWTLRSRVFHRHSEVHAQTESCSRCPGFGQQQVFGNFRFLEH